MAENKTQPTATSVTEFMDKIEDIQRKQDCYTLSTLMEDVTGEPPVLLGGLPLWDSASTITNMPVAVKEIL